MKKQLILLLASALVLTTGCSEKDNDSTGNGYGRIALDCGADELLDTRASAPAGTSFALVLTGEGYRGEWKTVRAFSSQDTLFKAGTYKAVITYGTPDAEGLNKTYYYGEQEFLLAERQTNNVQITATVANSQVVVRATEQFLRYFQDSKFTVTTGSGNKFDFSPGAAKAPVPVGVKLGTSLSVVGTAKRQSQTGTSEPLSVSFKEQKLEATLAATCHVFKFDAPDAGSATLTIYLGDDYTETRVLDLEMNDDAVED